MHIVPGPFWDLHGCENAARAQVGWWLPAAGEPLRMAITAVEIAGVSLLEAISIAKALGERHGDRVDADQELLGSFLPPPAVSRSCFPCMPVLRELRSSCLHAGMGTQSVRVCLLPIMHV